MSVLSLDVPDFHPSRLLQAYVWDWVGEASCCVPSDNSFNLSFGTYWIVMDLGGVL